MLRFNDMKSFRLLAAGLLIVLFGQLHCAFKCTRRSTLDFDLHYSRNSPLQFSSEDSRENALSLTFGDLPGYTGWARPASTSAHLYKVIVPNTYTAWPYTTSVAQAQTEWKAYISCEHIACQHQNALFDVRAYGPTVLTGVVTHHSLNERSERNRPLYEVTFFFHESGSYVIEIVLAYSHVDRLKDYPIGHNKTAYEGYLLPSMPMNIHVSPPPTSRESKRDLRLQPEKEYCTFSDLTEQNETSALTKGTWKVVENMRGGSHVPTNTSNVTFPGYVDGSNSLGIKMEYRLRRCSLLPAKEAWDRLSCLPNKESVHVLFVGDSNMRAQYHLFRSRARRVGIRTSHLSTYGGITRLMPELKRTLAFLHNKTKPGENLHVIFNSGLHDIDNLCGQAWSKARSEYISIPDDVLSCTEKYRESLEEFVGLLRLLRTKSLVFQSTPAGWLKWGNYGSAWPTARPQVYPQDPHACEEFNRIAYKIMQQKNVPVLDAFWLSRARPDNHEISESNKLGRKLVHLGQEGYDVLIRKWITAVVSTEQTFFYKLWN